VIEGVKAQLLLEARLDNVFNIVNRYVWHAMKQYRAEAGRLGRQCHAHEMLLLCEHQLS
jgi:hypothetical protein